jgi:LemA protein
MIGIGIGVLVAIIVIVLIIILVIAFIVMYNKFVRLRNVVEEAFSTMDVYLKKRFDLIPNLVETVKGYAAHERETLENVTSARSMIASAGTPEARAEAENMLTGALRSLFAVAENYPQLRANENFLDLQNQLKLVENDIANARKYYNGSVRIFNTTTETFPSNIVAKIFNFTRKPMYEVSNEAERENVNVQF